MRKPVWAYRRGPEILTLFYLKIKAIKGYNIGTIYTKPKIKAKN